MRSHRCEIDLKLDCLIFPDADVKLQFLSDGEIKKRKDLEEDDIKEKYDNMDIIDDLDKK